MKGPNLFQINGDLFTAAQQLVSELGKITESPLFFMIFDAHGRIVEERFFFDVHDRIVEEKFVL